MNKKRVFISYDYDADRAYKNLLLAWDANKRFEFYINDQSTDVSIDSTNAGVIRQVISRKIGESSVFLCLVGRKTYQSKWVNWEITKALELKKQIVVVKTEVGNIIPTELRAANFRQADSFTYDSVSRVLDF